jgi:hypothetical protein
MNNSTVEFLDLPDEMLIEILNKLSSVNVLYSLLGVNKRLDRLARDTIFTHFLDLTIKVSNYERCSMSTVMLDRFCLLILPEIHENIKCLLLEPLSIERILINCEYPKLDKLILNSIEPELFLNYLSGKKLFNLCK